MVRAENIESKIGALRAHLKLLERYKHLSIQEIQSSQDLKGATERYLFLATQCSIDLAEMACKFKGLGKPGSMGQSFELLCDHSLIDKSLYSSLIRMVGFRNALSHGYENLNYAVVEDVLKNRLADLEQFIAKIEKAI